MVRRGSGKPKSGKKRGNPKMNARSRLRKNRPGEENRNRSVLPRDVKKQNFLRREFARHVSGINSLRPISSVGTGVDYVLNFGFRKKDYKTTLDYKFSFGMLGERTISARVDENRKLINSANWVMAVDRKGNIEVFDMRALKDFVSRNWGLINKNKIIHKVGYAEVPVKLDDIYEQIQIEPIKAKVEKNSIHNMLNSIKSIIKEAERERMAVERRKILEKQRAEAQTKKTAQKEKKAGFRPMINSSKPKPKSPQKDARQKGQNKRMLKNARWKGSK